MVTGPTILRLLAHAEARRDCTAGSGITPGHSFCPTSHANLPLALASHIEAVLVVRPLLRTRLAAARDAPLVSALISPHISPYLTAPLVSASLRVGLLFRHPPSSSQPSPQAPLVRLGDGPDYGIVRLEAEYLPTSPHISPHLPHLPASPRISRLRHGAP